MESFLVAMRNAPLKLVQCIKQMRGSSILGFRRSLDLRPFCEGWIRGVHESAPHVCLCVRLEIDDEVERPQRVLVVILGAALPNPNS